MSGEASGGGMHRGFYFYMIGFKGELNTKTCFDSYSNFVCISCSPNGQSILTWGCGLRRPLSLVAEGAAPCAPIAAGMLQMLRFRKGHDRDCRTNARAKLPATCRGPEWPRELEHPLGESV